MSKTDIKEKTKDNEYPFMTKKSVHAKRKQKKTHRNQRIRPLTRSKTKTFTHYKF